MVKNAQHDFFQFVRENDVERVRSLLASDRSLANALILGDATLLSRQVWLNKSMVNVDANEQRDTPPLHHAVFHSHLDMARLLLEHGADVHALGYENNHELNPPIVLAAWEGGLEMLRLLLQYGADPNARSSNGVTPLSTAMRHGKSDRVELLKAHGAVA